MGFCIFNNIAVAAAYALEAKGLERVAIIDFDVHHGNGTEDMFSAPEWRERVMMASFFQHPFYPGSGTDNPAPNMFNVPLSAGSDGAAARSALEKHWLPALDEFKPQMMLISAGFDAHREDLLGGMALVEDDYAWMTRELMSVAARALAKAHRVDARGRLQPLGARPQRRGAREGARRALNPGGRGVTRFLAGVAARRFVRLRRGGIRGEHLQRLARQLIEPASPCSFTCARSFWRMRGVQNFAM